MKPHTKPLLITMGDPAGIGPEVICRCFAHQRLHNCIVIADPNWMAPLAKQWEVEVAAFDRLEAIDQNTLNAPKVMPVFAAFKVDKSCVVGQASCASGEAALASIDAALAHISRGSALVTAPISKEALFLAGSTFRGHTELLAMHNKKHVRMMFVSPQLHVVLDSVHVSLKTMLNQLNKEHLLETLTLTHAYWQKLFHKTPSIAVAALNPHASEGGMFGDEESKIILPVIQVAKQQGLHVEGPFAADSVYLKLLPHYPFKQQPYDVAVALYHDQALIPLKLLEPHSAVNITIGLDFLRTSPDHGTAFDIAGKNCANHLGMFAAIQWATQHSKSYCEYR